MDIAKYEDQLPRKHRFSLHNIFIYSASSASLIGLAVSPRVFPQDSVSLVYSIFLAALVATLLLHAYLQGRRKLHRYAQAIHYVHYVNHIMRDSIARMERGEGFEEMDVVLRKVINSISTCYTMLTGKYCRCTLKELTDDLILNTIIRDEISNKKDKIYLQQQQGTMHKLEDNTDFSNLWYCTDGCSRYFFENNLLERWKRQEYKNSSFITAGDPQIKDFLGFTRVGYWNLPYKSTMVLPLRYIDTFNPPQQPDRNKKTLKQLNKCNHPHWEVWGFLCIDCSSRNIFDQEYSPELGAAFADILYSYMAQAKTLLDNNENAS